MAESGEIKLVEEVIAYNTSNTNDSFELPLAEVKAIFKCQNKHQENPQGYIIVNEKHTRKYVSGTTEGLGVFVEKLAVALELSPNSFDLNNTTDKKEVTRIYLKRDKKNYQILPDTYAKDQAEGYEVIGTKSVFCKWDTSIDDLKQLGLIEIKSIGTSGQKITFPDPVRIGSLLIDGLEITSSNQRKDYPVSGFYARIANIENTENSLFEAYACLKLGEGKVSNQSNQISKENIQIQLSIAEIQYRFSYVFTDSHQLDLGHTLLFVKNNRIYYDRLKTFDDYSLIQLTTCHFYKEEVKIYNQLNNNQLIGVTPQGLLINQEQRAAVWVDDDLGVVGFTQKEYSYIFELKSLDHFFISNTRPARGRGGAALGAVFKDKEEVVKTWTMLEGEYQSFDKSAEVLEAMTTKPVKFLPEWVDD